MDIIILYPFEYGFLSLTHFQLCSLLGLLDAAHCRIGGRISFLQGMLIVAPIHAWKKNCMPFNNFSHGSSFIKPTVFKDYLDWRVGVWLYQTALMHRSGKTALLRRFITNSFGNDYYSTIGATYIKKTIEYKESSIELQAWPIAIWWRLVLGYGRAREVSGLGKQLLPRSGCVHFGLWYNECHLFK